MEQKQDEPRTQYTLTDALQLKGPDTNCMVHKRELLAEIGGWDEECRWLEDWDLFARCITRYPEGVHWVPKVLVGYRQVHGAGADGLCAITVQDAECNRKGWQYIIGKWQQHPGFAETAERLTAKHLRKCATKATA
jgi:hypothetical protein